MTRTATIYFAVVISAMSVLCSCGGDPGRQGREFTDVLRREVYPR